jgi:L-lactate dehydrogenase
MKIGIVGSGFVGSTGAYAMIMRGVGREIVLVDKNEERAEAEAYDLLHAVPFAYPLTVRNGGYEDLKDSRLVIISAGVSQKPGESRLNLLRRNAEVFRAIIPQVLKNAPQTILVIATNPLDIMTHLAARYAAEYDLAPARVIGTGTMLDTARFRSLVAKAVGVDPQHVHGYVVGEHGDSEVLTWSQTTVGGTHVGEFCGLQGIAMGGDRRREIDQAVRNAAYKIIEGKGATYYGIGSALAKLVDVILHDQRSILTVSSPADDVLGVGDVSVSLPRLVGGSGVLTTFPLSLDEQETRDLRRSASVVREAIEEVMDET